MTSKAREREAEGENTLHAHHLRKEGKVHLSEKMPLPLSIQGKKEKTWNSKKRTLTSFMLGLGPLL